MRKERSIFQNKHWELRIVFSYSIRFDNENTKTLGARCAHIKMAPTGPTHTHTFTQPSIIDSSLWSWGPRQCLCWLLPPLFFFIRIKRWLCLLPDKRFKSRVLYANYNHQYYQFTKSREQIQTVIDKVHCFQHLHLIFKWTKTIF